MNGQYIRRRQGIALLCLVVCLAGMRPASAEELSGLTGAQLFRQYCASCHGKGGEGDGPVAPFFKLLPPDLTLIAKRSGGTYPAERVRRIVDGRAYLTSHGTREMPVWGLVFPMAADGPEAGTQVAETSIALLVEYLRTIQKAPAPPR